jgi:hypothetical protein
MFMPPNVRVNMPDNLHNQIRDEGAERLAEVHHAFSTRFLTTLSKSRKQSDQRSRAKGPARFHHDFSSPRALNREEKRGKKKNR